MNDPENLNHQELERIFQTLNSPLDRSLFVSDVMRRVTRYTRVRRITLATATIAGFTISAAPFFTLANRIGKKLGLAMMHWAESMHPTDAHILAAAILLAVAVPSVLRWLSR